MIGLGLLEAIPEQAILANARQQQRLGVNGRPNRVWDDARRKTVLGRFGWKAGQPNINQQNVHAFSSDTGLTTNLRPFDDCTRPRPTACKPPRRRCGWRTGSQRQHPAPGDFLYSQPRSTVPP
ncbi:di-heme oxidoredictase family protein [Pseudomonas sp. PCH446]